ncbi:sugar ABC transporter substrate-binding protein [Paenibacillus sp. Marseille-Q4541]|uniref:ABC transporter substrate-binding protein n=1 Tax=Paenibacillus sp. Marseille-Q4541 TaxID=2831522 RepID=UPI001BA906C0|nr:sugar ABC transporter substrate-binding protein [Paenibacillus sp. Marseille-Q4541]
MKKKQVARATIVLVLLFTTLLSACASGGDESSGGDSGGKVKIKWATWGNPGELSRFQEMTKEFNKTHPDIEAEFIPIPGEYDQKILTQLTGGTAPDVFYAGDGLVVKLIENNSIENLTPLMDAETSLIKEEDYFPGLWGAAKRDDQIYGVAVDCNPMVLWYNKKVLQEAGITEMPADLQANGQWTWDKFQEMTTKIKDSKKYGYVLDNSWNSYHSWVTSNGGTVYDESGKFVGATDAKSKEAFQFLYDNVKSKNITFSGTLPKGQGGDAMFMSNQVGFVGAGRWYLPLFKKNASLEYDVVTWPTNTGNKIEPAGIPTAYLVLNKTSKNKEAAYQFFSEFVSKEGQQFRLQGGGNAVPSVQGVDDVVLEGNLPEHAQLFLDARDIGYALTPHEAGIPGLTQDIASKFEALWLRNEPLEASLTGIQDMANKKIEEYKNK